MIVVSVVIGVVAAGHDALVGGIDRVLHLPEEVHFEIIINMEKYRRWTD